MNDALNTLSFLNRNKFGYKEKKGKEVRSFNDGNPNDIYNYLLKAGNMDEYDLYGRANLRFGKGENPSFDIESTFQDYIDLLRILSGGVMK